MRNWRKGDGSENEGLKRRKGKWQWGIEEKEKEVTVRDWREGKGSDSEGLKRRKGKWQWGIEEKEREMWLFTAEGKGIKGVEEKGEGLLGIVKRLTWI